MEKLAYHLVFTFYNVKNDSKGHGRTLTVGRLLQCPGSLH